jgi:4-amino-4-deoxy-L-arabinose transferase-like glycosyltransferase
LDIHLYALDILNGDPTANLEKYSYIPNASYLSMTGMTYAGLYKIFGASVKTAKFFTVAISGLTCALIYLTGKEITKDYRGGLVAGFMYAGWPALVSYTGVPSSEHIAMGLIMVSTYIWILVSKREAQAHWVHSLGIYLVIGVIIGLVDWYRPVAFILALAILISEGLFLKQKERPWLKMICLLVLLMMYQFTSNLAYQINDSVNGIKNPSSRQRAGSTILIGANFDYKGIHNWDDFNIIIDVYDKYGDDFDAANRDLIQLAYQRIIGNFDKVPSLLEAKFSRVWQNDAGMINASSVGSNDAELLDYLGVIDLFYLVTIITLIFIATIFMIFRRSNKIFFMMQLFILGLSIMLLITEAQMHYRSILIPFLVLLAALGMKNLLELKRNAEKMLFNNSPQA